MLSMAKRTSLFADRSVLVTGGTGSFGRCFTQTLLALARPRKVIIFSRDELKQHEMAQEFDDPRLRFFLGDVRDRDRLVRAFDNVDFVVHAAALKQVPSCEYNPFEAVKTNILGAQNLIEAAIDRGINFLDCANMYGPYDERIHGPGGSERILAKAIKGKRDRVVITSKVEEPVGTGPNDKGLSRYHIMREVEHSLIRLGTDHIDIYLAHHPDRTAPIEETVSAFDRLVQDGKIRYYGLSNYPAWEATRALWAADKGNMEKAVGLQLPYNLFRRDIEDEVFGLVRDQGLGVMAYIAWRLGLHHVLRHGGFGDVDPVLSRYSADP